MIEKVLNQAHQEYKDGNYKKAAELYKLVVDEIPNQVAALEGFIKSLVLTGKFDEAYPECTRLLEINPNSLPAHLALSSIYRMSRVRKDYDKAEAEARKALELAPGSAKAHFSLAGVHYLKKNFIEARKEAKKAIELESNLAEAHLLLGGILSRQSSFKEALIEFKKAKQLKPNLSGVWINIVHSYIGKYLVVIILGLIFSLFIALGHIPIVSPLSLTLVVGFFTFGAILGFREGTRKSLIGSFLYLSLAIFILLAYIFKF